jgi:hypothetical protein
MNAILVARGLIIWTMLSRQLVVETTTKPNIGHLAPASEVAGVHFKIGRPFPFLNGMVCPPATFEAEARWPRRGLVVAATTSCHDNKVQMIRT